MSPVDFQYKKKSLDIPQTFHFKNLGKKVNIYFLIIMKINYMRRLFWENATLIDKLIFYKLLDIECLMMPHLKA